MQLGHAIIPVAENIFVVMQKYFSQILEASTICNKMGHCISVLTVTVGAYIGS